MPTVASMTGYAVRSAATDLGTVTVECRSVNGRFLDLNLRVAEELRFCEPRLRETVQKHVARGKMEVRVSLVADGLAQTSVQAEALKRVLVLQEAVRAVAEHASPLNVYQLLNMPGVVVGETPDRDRVAADVEALLTSALADFRSTREREGAALAAVILENCDAIEREVADVEARLPDILAHVENKLRDRLETALSGVLSENSTLTPEDVAERIRQEVTLYAIRMDVAEEINRLRTHVAEVRNILRKGGSVGRRLDFMAQELNREANTLGSKAAAIEMTNASMALKVNIEQIREQIQNLE